MYWKTAVSLFALSCLAMSGCQDSHDKVVQDYIAELKNMVNVLEGIETAEDAEKAKSNLKAIGEKIKTITRRKETLGVPDPAFEKTLKDKYGKQHHEIVTKQLDALMKIPIRVRMIVQEVTKDIPQLF
tara:strand:+ start:479 stop:862 length:384 start_codon:yes stop_codon:yes gene_type:complete